MQSLAKTKLKKAVGGTEAMHECFIMQWMIVR